jgi:co-chaperonin GroES (HSP10)
VKLRANSDRLIIRPEKPAKTTPSGRIVIPAQYRRKYGEPAWGTVLDVGPGMLMANGNRWPMPDCAVGDRVLYSPDGAIAVTLDGEQLHAVRQEFVHLVDETRGYPAPHAAQ